MRINIEIDNYIVRLKPQARATHGDGHMLVNRTWEVAFSPRGDWLPSRLSYPLLGIKTGNPHPDSQDIEKPP